MISTDRSARAQRLLAMTILRGSTALAMLAVAACITAPAHASPRNANRNSRADAGRVKICHQNPGNGRYHLIEVSKNALSAHEAHGDCVLDDQIDCTVDYCDRTHGCVHEVDPAACDNGDACDGEETCDPELGCISGEPVDCSDGNDCTDDSCDPVAGCVYSNNSDACDDGDPCTAGDQCIEGACAGGPPPDEMCDGNDADCDGLVDCDDEDCADQTACASPKISFIAPESTCSLSSVSCDASVLIPFQVAGGAPPSSLAFTLSVDAGADGSLDIVLDASALSGDAPDFEVMGTFPIGSHALLIDVEDAAGHSDSASIPFTVEDCKAPSPICINGLAIEFMPVEPNTDADGDGDIDAGAMTVYAADFIASPTTDCSPPVTYSINKVGTEVYAAQTSLVLTCDDDATTIVEIHAWDALGLSDYCETYVLVQDNQLGGCSP